MSATNHLTEVGILGIPVFFIYMYNTGFGIEHDLGSRMEHGGFQLCFT